uniref:Uncharacterized protein n=1 Tax=Sphaerodactylus townsendi TaxID=933632 RepID=A0ACB8FMH9_9SAUR
MAVSGDSATRGRCNSGEEKSPEAAAAAAARVAAGDGALGADCNGCCAPAGPEDPERRRAPRGWWRGAGGDPRLRARCKLCWAVGAGGLALLLALRLAKEEDPEDGEGAAPGGRWCPRPGSAGLCCCCCCLLAAYCWLGWDLVRAALRLRTAALLLAACCAGEALAQLAPGTAAEETRLCVAACGGLLLLGCLAAALGGLGVPRGAPLLLLALPGAVRLCAPLSWPPWSPCLASLLALAGILYARRHAWPGKREEEAEAGRGAEGAGLAAAAPPVPVWKRRRRSSSMIAAEMAGCGSKSHRRTSLPCIPREQVSVSQLIASE